jgi:transposase
MEACAGAHYWGRELEKPGHTVKLIPPQFVKLGSFEFRVG